MAIAIFPAHSAETPSKPPVETEHDPPDDPKEDINKLLKRVGELEKAEEKRKEAQRAKDAQQQKTPTVKWSGQIQADRTWAAQNESSRAEFGAMEGGAAFRRARLAMIGEYGMTDYRIEVDFALAGRPSFLDMYMGLKDLPYLGRLRVGHFFEPFSLERRSPNRFLTFMERALPDMFAPARNLGIKANNTVFDQRATWEVGMFRSDSDLFGDDVGDRLETAFSGRGTALVWYKDCDGWLEYLHLGMAYSFRFANAGQVRFRSQPEARVGSAVPNIPFIVDTGPIAANHHQLIGFEAAWVRGPFSVAAEYVLVPVDAAAAALFFHGWYVQTSLFLTGESRPYRRDVGIWDRVIPRREFRRRSDEGRIERGPGAWEIALRLSQLTLDSGPIRGGQVTNLTLGLNWYLTPFLRVTGNHVWSTSGGSREGPTQNFFALRVGYEF